jgi:2-polyprenyl-6-methoxyphenol hydroxylase-like FAD-dependent oxidoreductase
MKSLTGCQSEKLDRLPERLYVTGDALCEVNPVYGQGMTKAALNALVLRRQLAAGTLNNRGFFDQQNHLCNGVHGCVTLQRFSVRFTVSR